VVSKAVHPVEEALSLCIENIKLALAGLFPLPGPAFSSISVGCVAMIS
jgi:hypothetical protein